MNTFIKKHQFNYINKCLRELNAAFKNSIDSDILMASKAIIQEKIWSKFDSLTPEESDLLDISKIASSVYIDTFSKSLEKYVFGLPTITAAQLSRVFKKEKKLKVPKLIKEDKKLVYIGWIDESVKKLYVVYDLDGTLVGMSCRLLSIVATRSHTCSLCGYVGREKEVVFVSPECKVSSKNPDAYRSIGFYICLDSLKCNERITSTEKLESLLKKVNNL